MVEVQLLPEELHHPALKKEQPFWLGRRAKFWDLEFIEYASQEQLSTLETGLSEFLSIVRNRFNIPQTLIETIDFEICGSYGFGTQRWFSDIDIQLSTSDQRTQQQLKNIILPHKIEFLQEVYALSKRLKTKIEIHFSEWKNKQYNEIYSLKERRLYNRTEGVALSQLFKRRFNVKTQRYEPLWLDELPKCECEYWDSQGNYLI
jgi:hypothetical protein